MKKQCLSLSVFTLIILLFFSFSCKNQEKEEAQEKEVAAEEKSQKGKPAWSLSNGKNVLEPFRAIIRDKVFHHDASSHLKGYATPTNDTDHLIIVFFKLTKDTVTEDNLKWIIKDQSEHIFRPIGYGIPMPSIDGSVRMLGQLTEGEITSFTGGKEPLVALIFVLQKDLTDLDLVDPHQNKGTLQLSQDWLPREENKVENFVVLGSIAVWPGGKNWEVLDN